MTTQKMTHLDTRGHVRMVDVSEKTPSRREARAVAEVCCAPEVLQRLISGDIPKGDVEAVARIAGIAAVKKTPELLPLAHSIGIHGASVDVSVHKDHVLLESWVCTHDRTGVEMEALTAVSIAALAIVDMVKGVDRGVYIRRMGITAKEGGRSGSWSRQLP